MLANEKKVASDGYEVALFPCDTMYLSESRTPPEHDVLALDFAPRNTEGARISPMNCYAPFTGTIIYTGADHNLIFESKDKVHLPNGQLAYCRVLMAHSWNAPVRGMTFNQGDLLYTTGNYGQSSGEHLHMEVAIVESKSVLPWNTGGIGLRNGVHMWNGLFVDDTKLLRTGGYDWLTYGETPPVGKKKKNFPWVLYARKLRSNK